MQRTITYREQSRAFMAEAFEELEKGDLGLAAEKGWEAAAHIIKAIAQERGWAHGDRTDLDHAMNNIYYETRDMEFEFLYDSAVFLDFNPCEHYYSVESMERRLKRVEQFVNRAEDLLREMN